MRFKIDLVGVKIVHNLSYGGENAFQFTSQFIMIHFYLFYALWYPKQDIRRFFDVLFSRHSFVCLFVWLITFHWKYRSYPIFLECCLTSGEGFPVESKLAHGSLALDGAVAQKISKPFFSRCQKFFSWGNLNVFRTTPKFFQIFLNKYGR